MTPSLTPLPVFIHPPNTLYKAQLAVGPSGKFYWIKSLSSVKRSRTHRYYTHNDVATARDCPVATISTVALEQSWYAVEVLAYTKKNLE